jgi:AcrR family transcriptional regulator
MMDLSETMKTQHSAASLEQSVRKLHKTRPETDQRRAEIARIAFRLIAQSGLEGFRTRQVADAAGIDQGTLHYHFPSKEALIQAVVDQLIADFRANRAGQEDQAVGAVAELRNEIRDVAMRVKETPEQFRVLMELRLRAKRDPAIASILARLDHGFNQHLTNLVSRGVEQGVFRPDVNLGLAGLVLRNKLDGLGLAALVSSERVDEIASVVSCQMEAWLLLEVA